MDAMIRKMLHHCQWQDDLIDSLVINEVDESTGITTNSASDGIE